MQVQKYFRGGKSQYKGVSLIRDKWMAYINIEKRRHHLGFYADQESAARAYDAAARYYLGKQAFTNFEGTDARPAEELYLEGRLGYGYTSKYRGVHWDKKHNCWKAQLCLRRGKSLHLGHYKNELDAALEYDKQARNYMGERAKTNFRGP